jgi:hypothetical protein
VYGKGKQFNKKRGHLIFLPGLEQFEKHCLNNEKIPAYETFLGLDVAILKRWQIGERHKKNSYIENN